jgi:DHA1 family multidrug resistance protein-like MFS transporter
MVRIVPLRGPASPGGDNPRVLRFRRPRTSPVFWLLSGQLIMFTGVAAMFPIAPLYVRRHGGSSLDIALFIAGPLIANTLVQVPAGRLTDRIGRRPMLLGSRAAFGLLAFALFADAGPLWLLASLRTLQGVASGAYVPALRAALVDLSEPEKRAERFAQLQACEMVGLLVGPFLGGLVALWRDSAVFGVSGAAVFVGLIAMRRIPETRASHAAEPQPSRWWRNPGIVVPCFGVAALGSVFSMYDVVWPLYLAARGYSSLVIGITISLFAVPLLLLARPGGRLADRANRRWLMASSFTLTGACACLYPALRSLAPIIALGTVEACAVVLIEPTLFSVIGDSSPPAQRGRAMGLGGLFQFGGSAIGAAVLGTLYGVGEGISFWGAGGALFAAALLCAAALPARSPDRRTRPAVEMASVMPLDS